MRKDDAGVATERHGRKTTRAPIVWCSEGPGFGSDAKAVRGGIVRRTALTRRLCSVGGGAVLVLVAPAGYGKSTLLSTWEALDERPFLWLHVEDPTTQRPGVSLASLLGAQKRDAVLVLDDAHSVPPAAVREVVRGALRELAPGSTVVLSSRSEVALPLGRLRANRAIVELGVEDLRMTSTEAAILLRGAGLELDGEGVAALTEQTEGWPAGLYLAALSLRGQKDPPMALGRFGGDDHLLSAYFREEVLSLLPRRLTRFAIATAVLDELSGSLCDAVLGESGSAELLEELARATAWLRPVDRAHERYRWHGLLRDTLLQELRRQEPRSASGRHGRASIWHASHGDLDRAIAHAVWSDDSVRAGDLLWSNLEAYRAPGRNRTVREWLNHFNPRQIGDHAPLALAAAFNSIIAGDADHARHWAALAAAALSRTGPVERTPSLTAGLAGIEAYLATAGARAMNDAATRACEQEPLDGPWRSRYMYIRGVAAHLLGERTTAREVLDEAIALSAAPSPKVMTLCLAQSAMLAIEREDLESAGDLTDRARDALDEHGLVEDPLSALVFAAAAAARAHEGRVDEAKSDLRAAIKLLTTLGDFVPWYDAQAHILVAHASLWLADVVGGRTLLAEASRFARRIPDAVIFAQWFDGAWAYLDSLAETSLAGPSSLTIAELRILRFLPSHRSFREIAAQLGVSANTVKTQAHAVYRKLGAASRSEAVARATEAGLLGQ